MSMPFYVAPEQVMKDRADFARKNIARGRPLVATIIAEGILLVGENTSRTLHKVSEIYDRIAFAGVGKYTEFDMLRKAGVREADLKGYQYSREDVDGRSLANTYAQYLGQVFTHEMKPLEVEILVAEVGTRTEDAQLYHVTYDGVVFDEDRFTVLGGDSDAVSRAMEAAYTQGWALGDALKSATGALASTGTERTLTALDLEVAILDQTQPRRAFRRLEGDELAGLLA